MVLANYTLVVITLPLEKLGQNYPRIPITEHTNMPLAIDQLPVGSRFQQRLLADCIREGTLLKVLHGSAYVEFKAYRDASGEEYNATKCHIARNAEVEQL